MSSTQKKYFWMKQPSTFFQDAKIKKLRKIAGGDTYTIIYQKIMLLSIVSGGVIVHEGIEDTLAQELSLVLDEDVENVKVTIAYMQVQGLIEELDDHSFLLPCVPALIGSECDSAERVRRLRERKKETEKQEALHCNAQVTQSNTELEEDRALQCNAKKTRKKPIIPTKVEMTDNETIVHYPRYSTSRRFVSPGAP